jgi:hypothetical protein
MQFGRKKPTFRKNVLSSSADWESPFFPEDGGTGFLRKVSTFQSDYSESHLCFKYEKARLHFKQKESMQELLVRNIMQCELLLGVLCKAKMKPSLEVMSGRLYVI